MPLSWNEIKNKALAFSKRWADAANEDSEAKPFWIDFFEIFGISDKRVASFEHAVKKLPGAAAGYKPQIIVSQNPVNIRAAERVAFLFERYVQLTSLLPVAKPKAGRKRASTAPERQTP